MMDALQKRRWMALAEGWDKLSEKEQEKLRDRMQTWSSLSAQQRSQARLNFALTNRLATDKRAQWEAYQALSDEEKRLLAARAAPGQGRRQRHTARGAQASGADSCGLGGTGHHSESPRFHQPPSTIRRLRFHRSRRLRPWKPIPCARLRWWRQPGGSAFGHTHALAAHGTA